jgi:glycosyltransferase involved in cell wall biosynthesis
VKKVSVIIPIYHVEAYIERCVRSLMEQTLDELEFIFVDDCSPDGSIEVLKHVLSDYPQRKGQTFILYHDANKGLPAARNTGLNVAKGEYIFHCDSDDYLECDALSLMYEKAKMTNADIVYSDWYLAFPKKERYMRCPEYVTAEDALRGLLHGTMKYNVWNKLVRRSLYTDNEIRFPVGHGMGEDMTMILLFAKARSVAYLPVATYHYVRQNENAFTASRSEASYNDLKYNADHIIYALQGKATDSDIAAFKLNVKFPFIISNNRTDYERWQQWFPEANDFIPQHQQSARARFLENCADKQRYGILRLYYLFIHHFLYGIIYSPK